MWASSLAMAIMRKRVSLFFFERREMAYPSRASFVPPPGGATQSILPTTCDLVGSSMALARGFHMIPMATRPCWKFTVVSSLAWEVKPAGANLETVRIVSIALTPAGLLKVGLHL